MLKTKTCKKCSSKRYANQNLCFKHWRENERIKKEEKKLRKKEKHKLTKSYNKEICDKLIRENDRLFQELGRQIYKNCYFGHIYSCIHHFVRKSQSLFTRYDLENGMPICQGCHCEIHQAQNSILEAQFVLDKGKDWLDRINKKKETIVVDKLEFLKEKNLALKKSLGK